MTILLLLIGSYLVGNVLTATVIGNLFYKRKIRAEGSGNPGARNAGRVLGKKAFVATFLGDALKGAVAVFAAKWLGFNMTLEIAALFAVMLGHIFPVFFKFRGGQGVSTFIGGLLALHLPTVAVMIGVFGVLYAFIRSFTLAGFGAMVLVPLIFFLFSLGTAASIGMCFCLGLLVVTHKDDLMKKLEKKRETPDDDTL
jgi:glycerol-3-phosphate acyltransferase PlsY